MVLRVPSVFCAVLLVLTLSACTGGTAPDTTSSPTGDAGDRASHSPASASGAPGPIQHVVIVMEENKPASSIIGNQAAPYLNKLAETSAQASHYAAITHPSLPNYLALTSGTTAGITTDCNPPGGSCLSTGPNLGQALDRTGRSWRMYAEGMPAPCTTANTGLYAVKHNPFLYFPSVTANHAYCTCHDVSYDRFAADLATTTSLPAFAFVSPDLCDDMHDCSVAHGDAWLQANIPRILNSPAFTRQRSLLVVTFDEGNSSDNIVPCIFAGPAARPHTITAQPFTHYSLLRTLEEAFGLPPLTHNDGSAPTMAALLK